MDSNKGLTYETLVRLIKDVPVFEFMGFTFSQEMWNTFRPNFQKNLTDPSGYAFGVPFYVVSTQPEPILRWYDKRAMQAYIEASNRLAKEGRNDNG